MRLPTSEKSTVKLSALPVVLCRARRRAIRQARITRPKGCLPNAYEILVTRYDQFHTEGWVTFGEYLTGKGHRPPTSVGARKLERLLFRVVLKYPQCII